MRNVALTGMLHNQQWRGGLKRWGRERRQKVAVFRQTSANFRQRRLRVLTILIYPPNSPKLGESQSQIWFLQTKIDGGNCPNCPDATTSLCITDLSYIRGRLMTSSRSLTLGVGAGHCVTQREFPPLIHGVSRDVCQGLPTCATKTRMRLPKTA